MTSTTSAAAAFPLVRGRTKGYDRAAVDDFLARARSAFEADGEPMSAADVRQAAFPLVRRGYQVAAVDTALGRIEDAFAARERELAIGRDGAQQWVGSARETAQTVLDRFTRPAGERFERVSRLRYGYRVDEVDIVADKLTRYLASGDGVTVEQVRGVAFRMERGGYREVQVDAALDAVVEVMLAVT